MSSCPVKASEICYKNIGDQLDEFIEDQGMQQTGQAESGGEVENRIVL